jgi:uncharacterized coiled-coil protein SlyX
MKKLSLLLSAALLLSACTTTKNVKPKVSAVKKNTLALNRVAEENLMLKKAVVKLIRKYHEVDKKAALQEEKLQRLEKKTAFQEKSLKRLDSKTERHDQQINEMYSGMHTIRNFLSDDPEGEFDVEVEMPVIKNAEQNKILKPAPKAAE